MAKEKFNKFSVPLGLLDYGNPILYSVTIIIIIRNIYSNMGYPYNIILLLGALLSIMFGFVIPTGKVIVGLGLLKFKMPVSLVFCVNTGILLSGLMLLKNALKISPILLLGILLMILLFSATLYKKQKKINTIAVLTGAIGYLFTYMSLIIMSFQKDKILPILMYGVAIVLFIILCGIDIKANLKNPKVHWIIEVTNIICQLLVTISTIILWN